MRQLFKASLLLCILMTSVCNSQARVNNHEKIDAAMQALAVPGDKFSKCLVSSHSGSCIDSLVAYATDPYTKYVIAGMLYEIDAPLSYKLHKEAYHAMPEELSFNLEYALQLHRQQSYADATRYYLSMWKRCLMTSGFMYGWLIVI